MAFVLLHFGTAIVRCPIAQDVPDDSWVRGLLLAEDIGYGPTCATTLSQATGRSSSVGTQ